MRHPPTAGHGNRRTGVIESDPTAVERRDDVEPGVEEIRALEEEGATLGEEDREAVEIDHLPIHLGLCEVHVVRQVDDRAGRSGPLEVQTDVLLLVGIVRQRPPLGPHIQASLETVVRHREALPRGRCAGDRPAEIGVGQFLQKSSEEPGYEGLAARFTPSDSRGSGQAILPSIANQKSYRDLVFAKEHTITRRTRQGTSGYSIQVVPSVSLENSGNDNA